ncbi:MAG TPA: YggT family protein [Candidatus Saccharimonadales bacterium]|nr:YggT family protein [Candidatus Saccharimonadales bacterium]
MLQVLVTFIDLFVLVMNGLILARVITSWIVPDPTAKPWSRLIYDLTEPVLAPVRRLLPGGGMIDLAPLVAFFALQALQLGAHYLISALV